MGSWAKRKNDIKGRPNSPRLKKKGGGNCGGKKNYLFVYVGWILAPPPGKVKV